MIGLAHSSFRAIAPDYRGHELSDPPSQPDKASYRDLISGVFGIIDSLAIPKNFGGRPTYLFALAYLDRVLGVITIGVPIVPLGPLKFVKKLPEGLYISRWQEPGRAEADFRRFDAKTVVWNIYILFSRSKIPIAVENQEIMDLVDPFDPLPPWFTKEDLAAYGALYEKSGFQTALHIPYRALREEFGLTNLIVKVPSLYIMGGKDYVNKFPGIDYYIDIGRVKSLSPIWRFNSCPKDRISFKNNVGGLLIQVFELHSPAEKWHRLNMYGGRWPWSDPDDMGPQDDNPSYAIL
ncbi:hypothetical protein PS2_036523 [Malus domestica]